MGLFPKSKNNLTRFFFKFPIFIKLKSFLCNSMYLKKNTLTLKQMKKKEKEVK